LACCNGENFCAQRGASLACIRGAAECRGDRWAERVARKTKTRQPWPAFDGKCRDIAIRLVVDMDLNPNGRVWLATLAPISR
jgi:hypothetical protein